MRERERGKVVDAAEETGGRQLLGRVQFRYRSVSTDILWQDYDVNRRRARGSV